MPDGKKNKYVKAVKDALSPGKKDRIPKDQLTSSLGTLPPEDEQAQPEGSRNTREAPPRPTTRGTLGQYGFQPQMQGQAGSPFNDPNLYRQHPNASTASLRTIASRANIGVVTTTGTPPLRQKESRPKLRSEDSRQTLRTKQSSTQVRPSGQATSSTPQGYQVATQYPFPAHANISQTSIPGRSVKPSPMQQGKSFVEDPRRPTPQRAPTGLPRPDSEVIPAGTVGQIGGSHRAGKAPVRQATQPAGDPLVEGTSPVNEDDVEDLKDIRTTLYRALTIQRLLGQMVDNKNITDKATLSSDQQSALMNSYRAMQQIIDSQGARDVCEKYPAVKGLAENDAKNAYQSGCAAVNANINAWKPISRPPSNEGGWI